MKKVAQPRQADIDSRSVNLPPSRHQKTLIFDLDETLVHCIDDIENLPFDKHITVNFPTGETVDAGINIRPYAYDCLKKASENYQIVIFTASHKSYADSVLDTLEEEFRSMDYLTDEQRQIIDQAPTREEGIRLIKKQKEKQQLF